MNSEQWEQLWRDQAVPPSAADIDQFHEQIRNEPEEWERSLDETEWLLIRIGMVCIALTAAMVFMRGFEWDRWLMLLNYLVMVGWLLMRRFERRRIYQDFGLPVQERLDRMECLLRARFASRLNKVVPLCAVLPMGLSAIANFDVGWMGVGVGGALIAGFMGYAARAQARVDRTRLEKALQQIEQARAQLGINRSPPTAG